MTDCTLFGRTAFIAGAATPFGRRIARALAEAGATLVLGDEREAAGNDAAAALRAEGADARYVWHDATDAHSWDSAIFDTLTATDRLDVIVICAGSEPDAEDPRRSRAISVTAAALGLDQALHVMRPDGPAGNGGTVLAMPTDGDHVADHAVSGLIDTAARHSLEGALRVEAHRAATVAQALTALRIGPSDIGRRVANALAAA